ncbi:MAG TPA: MarR family transcriptional regulator, partial [Phycisphaerales bacterium]|nr:MarR family transcriptional regulator [Phycisphaerales bacterium]
LQEELHLDKPLAFVEHEALLNLYYTAAKLKKRAGEFFGPYGLTDVQFQLLMLLRHQGGKQGLSQARLSELMQVNRANVTGLVDRLERESFVRRTAAEDRRYNIIQLTDKANRLLDKIDVVYGREVKTVMGALSQNELTALIRACGKLRENL